jgi:hypothetical protein
MPALLLPVLPKPASRPPARVLHPQLRARRPKRSAPAPFCDAGLIAICLSGVALVTALVAFSIVRDIAALNGPAQPLAAPLRP